MDAVDKKAIIEFVHCAESDIKFVFVSACHSEGAGEAFAEAGVEHVVNILTSSSFFPFFSVVFYGDHFVF